MLLVQEVTEETPNTKQAIGSETQNCCLTASLRKAGSTATLQRQIKADINKL